MGFMKECLTKYDAEVFDLFGLVLTYLPVATVLDNRILIVHGGVPRKHSLKLTKLDGFVRNDYDAFERNQILMDLFWSDPHTADDWVENKRGAGINYGADHVYKFIKHNEIEWIVRSHECVPQGYLWPYGDQGMLVTLFSASNYCCVANNMGCFMRIPASRDEKPSFIQYMATSSESDLVVTNLEGLIDVVCIHRSDLLARFQEKDVNGTNHIEIPAWEHVMDEVLQMKLNWPLVRPLLTSVEPDHTINYVGFLNRYQVRGLDDSEDIAKETRTKRQAIFNGISLFQVFDQDGNGTINLDEFKAGIEILNQHLPAGMKPFTHPEELMRALDFTHDNEININEFMECFRIHANLTVQAKWRRARTKLRALRALGVFHVVSTEAVITASDVGLDEVEAAPEVDAVSEGEAAP
ncbi:serine threonine-protein phosphatase [Aphanomyces cochlioides]|nr:serine threonine-protein phosphatase [Aphanomyces cochlioides]